MRLPRAVLVAGLVALGAAALSTRALGQTASGLAAYRTVCSAERTKLISDLRQEIRAQQQPTWTAAQEQKRLDSDFHEVATATPAQLKAFSDAWAEFWKEARGIERDPEFIQRAELLLGACAVTFHENWNAGIRDIATLTRKWNEARTVYRSGKAPGGAAPAATSAPGWGNAPPSNPTVPNPPATSDPYAGAPADCVRIAETPHGSYGAFMNVCDYPVNFVYCAFNPKKGAWSEHFKCDVNGSKLGVDGIAAHGRQAAHIKEAESVHWFACRKPKMPQNARFDGKQIISICK